MYEVTQDEPSEDFKRAWQAAGCHLGPMGGDSLKWLRASLNPPMAEHLSFCLGNQLFFIFLEAAEYVYERENSLFLDLSHEAGAIPCIMPMRGRLTDYEPALPGWGLIHAETKEPVDPGALVSDELIEMTDWELHDFAIQVVKTALEEEGKNVFSAQSDRRIDPSLWFEENGDAYWVVVREARYPLPEVSAPGNLRDIAADCSRMATVGFFASVLVANDDDPFDPDAATNGNFLPLYRGHGMFVRFEGLQDIDL